MEEQPGRLRTGKRVGDISYRINTRDRRPTRRIEAKVITLQPAMVQ
jgi:hypothetical protein